MDPGEPLGIGDPPADWRFVAATVALLWIAIVALSALSLGFSLPFKFGVLGRRRAEAGVAGAAAAAAAADLPGPESAALGGRRTSTSFDGGAARNAAAAGAATGLRSMRSNSWTAHDALPRAQHPLLGVLETSSGGYGHAPGPPRATSTGGYGGHAPSGPLAAFRLGLSPPSRSGAFLRQRPVDGTTTRDSAARGSFERKALVSAVLARVRGMDVAPQARAEFSAEMAAQQQQQALLAQHRHLREQQQQRQQQLQEMLGPVVRPRGPSRCTEPPPSPSGWPPPEGACFAASAAEAEAEAASGPGLEPAAAASRPRPAKCDSAQALTPPGGSPGRHRPGLGGDRGAGQLEQPRGPNARPRSERETRDSGPELSRATAPAPSSSGGPAKVDSFCWLPPEEDEPPDHMGTLNEDGEPGSSMRGLGEPGGSLRGLGEPGGSLRGLGLGIADQ